MQVRDKSFRAIVFLDRHNHQETNNWIQEENHRIQTNVEDHNIDLESTMIQSMK